MPKLTVASRFIETPAIMPSLANASVFLRSGMLLIGHGEVVRLSATGADRISQLSSRWAQLVEGALIQDSVELPGSGMVAFVSITFADSSQHESVLIVPETLTVIREDRAWVTTFSVDGSGESENSARVSGADAPAAKPIQQSSETLTPKNLDFSQGLQTADNFTAAVEAAVARIQAGALSKVVLARDLTLEVGPDFDLGPILERLHERYPKCWTYSVADNFGASPELLIRSSRGEVSARVLAGTAARGTDPHVDRAIADGLAQSTKNKHEHAFAVDSLVKKLEPFCDSVNADSEPFSLALPDLWHLATDVRGHLKSDFSLLDVVSQLHPTAAVAGTPRESAQALIEELEPFDRGGYAGPVGWVAADGSGELAIALRGGRVERTENQSTVRAFAGCGIVAESEPQAELDETNLKFRAVRWAFREQSQ